jgi:hypothetical protein
MHCTQSVVAPDFLFDFEKCRADTESKKGGFFNGNMRPERLPSAKGQADGSNCGTYVLLGVCFVQSNVRPALRTKINTLRRSGS